MSEWREMTLGDLGRVVTGKTPSTSVSDYFGGDVPFVTPSDMFGHKVISRTARNLTKAGVAAVKGSFIPKGSVMVSCIGSDMGKVTIAAHDCVSNQQINSIVVCENFSADFIYYNLSTRKAELQSMACSGSAQPILNKGHFSQLPISLPPLSEQRAIASVLGALDDKIELNRRMNETLEALAQSLFKSWFVDATQSALPKGWRSETIDNVCSVVTRGVTPKYQEGSGRFIINQRVNRGFELDWSEMKELESDHGFAEAGFVRISWLRGFGFPRMVAVRNLFNFLGSQFPVDAVNQHTHFPRINEKCFAAPVAALVDSFCRGPETRGRREFAW